MSNADVVTTIRNLISLGQKNGIILFTDSTGLPDELSSGNVSYIKPSGTGTIYLECKWELHRYYGYILGNNTAPVWNKYILSSDVKFLSLTQSMGSESTSKPWLELKAQISRFEDRKLYIGTIVAGSMYAYNGFYLKSGNGYGSFWIHGYGDNDEYHVWLSSGTWKYKRLGESTSGIVF